MQVWQESFYTIYYKGDGTPSIHKCSHRLQVLTNTMPKYPYSLQSISQPPTTIVTINWITLLHHTSKHQLTGNQCQSLNLLTHGFWVLPHSLTLVPTSIFSKHLTLYVSISFDRQPPPRVPSPPQHSFFKHIHLQIISATHQPPTQGLPATDAGFLLPLFTWRTSARFVPTLPTMR